ncbi:Myosin regulatory light chain 2, ventricular/cardiac muscle isoform [Saguinus oedipus]|uniref:Myosin regulatory light chain 2, ventricular/cardiac muscle isoform n=1 Tax=Saguinus oedipus TaxID=9490 RepID=A0ABQ9V028_SAGOE|nr:Myosin regulatory light chain 2, ventricular/cardiac muscle isoform [Saguinus oedipus]
MVSMRAPGGDDVGGRGREATVSEGPQRRGRKAALKASSPSWKKPRWQHAQRNPNQCPDRPQITAAPGDSQTQNKRAPKKAKKRVEGNSNVFSMFEQTQIQEFKEAFTIMDQNRDGFIDKNDLRDTFAALGRVNVKNEEIDEMIKEAPGPINFTVFLTMFGEKLKGADPEETILNAFKVFDPEGKGVLKADYVRDMLTTQAERFSKEEIDQMFAAFPPDVTGNLDYKNLVHIITHGEEKD